MYTLTHGKIITPHGIVPGSVTISGGTIAAVGDSVPAAATVDVGGRYIAPGLIDIHIHGSAGHDVLEGAKAFKAMAVFLARHGTTAFLPTALSDSADTLLAAARAVREVMQNGTGGAQVLGLHLEGPFVNPARAGAQPVSALRPPSVEEFQELMAAAGRQVKLLTLAPELPGAMELIRFATGQGVTVAAGHTDATYEITTRAVSCGLRHGTHLFNAMRGLHHREPGVVGAILDHHLSFEIIADGIHLHPATLRIALAARRPEQPVLVSDAMSAAGLGDGCHRLGSQAVTVTNGRAHLADGTIAGSTLTLLAAVKYMVSVVGIPLETAVAMATANPARVIGLETKGVIAPGRDADLVVFDDHWQVWLTLVGGQTVYRRDESWNW